jgi:hypothetical protein|tara:strand:- start:737 stop:838 length:102 start_codon:yes stop_codon:yes gene_type:complete
MFLFGISGRAGGFDPLTLLLMVRRNKKPKKKKA